MHDDRRPGRGGQASRSPLQNPGPRHRRVPRTPGREKAAAPRNKAISTAVLGAGHFVKMVHNGIEYGIMAAYAEGLNILKHANVGKKGHPSTPRRRRCVPGTLPVRFQPDGRRRGMAARQRDRFLAAGSDRLRFAEGPDLEKFGGRVSIPARVAGPYRPRLKKARRPRFWRRRCSSVSRRAAKMNLPTSFFRRCVSSLAGTWKRRHGSWFVPLHSRNVNGTRFRLRFGVPVGPAVTSRDPLA